VPRPICHRVITQLQFIIIIIIIIIIFAVLYGCETWSQTLREERSLKVFENRVLRRDLGLRGTR